MKLKLTLLVLLLSVLWLTSCVRKTETTMNQSVDTIKVSTDSVHVSGTLCNIKFGNVEFTKAVNGADSLVTIQKDGIMEFRCGEKKDFFCDPNNGELSNNTAPILLTKIDNTKPFTFTAKVTPEFTKTGTYNAGALYIYVHDSFWQKFAFEQDERGNHRIVTVRTQGTSDDNNHDIVKEPSVYLKISSDTRTVASYYSLDKKEWRLARLYKNYYPEEIWVGICNQCPMDKGSRSLFEDLSLEQNSVSDFRMGN